MTEAGLKEVERAKADGRWARAYKSVEGKTIPGDLKAAIDAGPKARRRRSLGCARLWC